MAMPEIEEVKDLALKYDKPTLGRLAQMGQISPTLAVMAGMMRDRVVQSEMKPPSPPTVAQEVMQPMGQRMGLAAAAQPRMPQTPPQMPQQPRPQGQGLNQVPVPPQMFERQGMAGGGIVAFQAGGAPQTPTFADMYSGLTPDLEALAAARRTYMGDFPMESAEDRKRELLAQLAVQAGGTLASTPGGFAEGLGAAAKSISQPLMAGLSDIRKDRMARLAAERAEKGKVFEGVLGMRGKAAESAAAEARLTKELTSRETTAKADRESREEIERANRESREAIASLPDNKERAAQVIFDEAKEAGMPITMEQAMARATAALEKAPDRYNALSNRLTAANKEIASLRYIMHNQVSQEKDPKKKKQLMDSFEEQRTNILRNYAISEADLKELNTAGRPSSGAPMGSTRSMGGAPAGSTPPPPPGFTLNPPYSPQ